MIPKITTKQGDDGQTTALSGDTLSKTHPIMECIGALDELRAQTALLRLAIIEKQPEDRETAAFLLWLLNAYFLAGASCSDPLNKKPDWHRGTIDAAHIQRIEDAMDRLEQELELPRGFVVSASNAVAAQADLTAAVARRFERRLAALKEQVPDFDTTHLLPFANRLSDYFYILARRLDGGEYQAVDYGAAGSG